MPAVVQMIVPSGWGGTVPRVPIWSIVSPLLREFRGGAFAPVASLFLEWSFATLCFCSLTLALRFSQECGTRVRAGVVRMGYA